jgi:FdhD protein
MDPVASVARGVWRNGRPEAAAARLLAEEAAIAFTYNRATAAVTMATPSDLTDLAIGWSLTEGVVERADEIEELEIVEREIGFECRMWLAEPRAEALLRRQRLRIGPSGCGLCGIESLEEAVREPPRVGAGRSFVAAALAQGLAMLPAAQKMHGATHAVHAAAYWEPAQGLIAVREDVGRHNALDKLAGALARAGRTAEAGVVFLSSRVSIEMIQKAARIGAPLVVAVSAPTAQAVRMAQSAGITLVAVARADGFEVFTHPERVLRTPAHDVA